MLLLSPESRLGMLKLAASGLLGRLDGARNVITVKVTESLIEASAAGLLVAMRPPLQCHVRRRALRVVAPPLSA